MLDLNAGEIARGKKIVTKNEQENGYRRSPIFSGLDPRFALRTSPERLTLSA